MILTAHQPVYLPWLGLFHKIYLAEKFCIFDIVQYQKKDYNNRNKIKTHSGPIWLSVPVESKDHLDKLICDIRIIDNGWNRKHFKSIASAYQKSPYFDRYIGEIERLLIHNHYDFLCDLNADILRFSLEALGIDRPVVKASDYEFSGKKSDLVLDMCIKLGADTYIFGAQGGSYADRDSFSRNGIKIYFQDYHHPVYHQLHKDFEPYMSVIDLIFNEGPDSLQILLAGNPTSMKDVALI
jgi:hypothetical protein